MKVGEYGEALQEDDAGIVHDTRYCILHMLICWNTRSYGAYSIWG